MDKNKNEIVTKEKLEKYFSVTKKALELAKKSIAKEKKKAEAILDMAQRYYQDARWFQKKGDFVLAFASLNYAHGWLDCGSKLGIFNVKDSRFFVLK